ncbi:hypothetical protein B0T13DRAFT_492227 [Neurospora crassa]|nr:hypothetical protein B0T13DRAFT_492227 [Neurospora crassa]
MIGCCESGDIGAKAVALSNMFHQSDEACCHITPRRVSQFMMAAVTANRLTAGRRSKASVLFIHVGLNGNEHRVYLSHGRMTFMAV